MNTFSPSATRLIRTDHSHVLSTLHQYRVDSPPAAKRTLVRTACLALDLHAQLVDEFIVPALALASSTPHIGELDRRAAHQVEMRRVIAQLRRLDPSDPSHDPLVMTLLHHTLRQVADDEAHLLPMAERTLKHQLNDLGAQMLKRRFELTRPSAAEFANGVGWTTSAGALAALCAIGVLVAVWWRVGHRQPRWQRRLLLGGR